MQDVIASGFSPRSATVSIPDLQEHGRSCVIEDGYRPSAQESREQVRGIEAHGYWIGALCLRHERYKGLLRPGPVVLVVVEHNGADAKRPSIRPRKHDSVSRCDN